MKIRKVAQSAGLVATVVDHLNSESATDALSAKQGKLLSEKILGGTPITNITTTGTSVNAHAFKTPGRYYFGAGYEPLDTPDYDSYMGKHGGVLEVVKTDDTIQQIWTGYNTMIVPHKFTGVYTRQFLSTSQIWTNWEKFVLQSDISNMSKALNHAANIYNGNSKTFTLEPLHNYLLICTQYGQGNIYADSVYAAIITTGTAATNTSRYTNIVKDIASLVNIEFIDGLTVKITGLANKWMITSLTRL